VTLKNFGRDRRYPITSRFRDPGTELPAPERAASKSPLRAKAGAADF
jgi:NAD+ synthase